MPDPGADILLPPHAYVPGQNARHPEGLFDDIKATVTADTAPSDLHRTAAWQAGLSYLEGGFYWECHEVLEAVWMQTPNPSPEREMVQAIIQIANARLKLKMGRPKAVMRLCQMVRQHQSRCPEGARVLGKDVAWLDVHVNAVLIDLSAEYAL